MMTKTTKLCPIGSGSPSNKGHCAGEKCAWFVVNSVGYGECAIVSIERLLH